MNAMAGEMADGFAAALAATVAAWRRARAWSARNGLGVYLLMIGAAIVVAALVATLVANTILDPNVTFTAGELSPNGRWVALKDQVDPGPMMGDVDSAVELRPHDGLLVGPTANRTFLMKFKSDKVRIQRIHWYADATLEIVYAADADDAPRNLVKYVDDVVIDYRRVEP